MRGFILSTDAIVAITLLITVTTFFSGILLSSSSPELRYQRLYYTGKDVINIIQELKINDLTDLQTVQDYIAQGIIVEEDMNKSLLDVVGALWTTGNISHAHNLTRAVFESALNSTAFGYELLIGGDSIFKKYGWDVHYLARSSTLASGYALGKPISGYVASAYLIRLSRVTHSYTYFGGYVGDGNITVTVDLPDDAVINGSELEVDIGSDFDLYVNGNPAGNYSPSAGNMTADTWTICSTGAECSYFSPGANTVEIIFDDMADSYIGGGFLKTIYITSKPDTIPIDVQGTTATKRYNFPGIEGTINIYSGFYVPGTLNSMNAYMHFRSNYSTFLVIGNATIFDMNTSGEHSFSMDNARLLSNITGAGLSYGSLSNRTIPLRMGLRNISYVMMGGANADVFSVSDLSGSMDGCIVYDVPYVCNYYCLVGKSKSCGVGDPDQCTGNVCGGDCVIPYDHWLDCDQTKLDFSMEAQYEFVDIVLNTTGNRLGLVGYTGSIENYHPLSDNAASLKSEIENYEAKGSTCICCGVIEAVEKLVENSDPSKYRSVVVMSDGEANVECEQTGTGDPKQDAIQASCDAYDDHNITIHTIGFGDDVDEATLQAMAACGGGEYHFANITELSDVYAQIAQDILNASYSAQTVEIYGNVSLDTVLYADSYIEFNYTPIQLLDYAEVSVPVEFPRFGGVVESPKNSSFIPHPDAKVIDSVVTSYSSAYWTDRLFFNSSNTSGWEQVFDLGRYGEDYRELGDPYIVSIPTDLIVPGETNWVSIDTAMGQDNTTGGSPHDRVINILGIRGAVDYGDMFGEKQDAADDAITRLEEYLETYNITTLEARTIIQTIPEITALWGPSAIEMRTWL